MWHVLRKPIHTLRGCLFFSQKVFMSSLRCAAQTTCRRFGLQYVCFLEDISLKNCMRALF
ncbi:hypothetical protein HanIR_Chr08g0365091 [Helianthus annuus]|nr:hypothetical protein HanIR_Chr08g0365091 [Helianthus annuus]